MQIVLIKNKKGGGWKETSFHPRFAYILQNEIATCGKRIMSSMLWVRCHASTCFSFVNVVCFHLLPLEYVQNWNALFHHIDATQHGEVLSFIWRHGVHILHTSPTQHNCSSTPFCLCVALITIPYLIWRVVVQAICGADIIVQKLYILWTQTCACPVPNLCTTRNEKIGLYLPKHFTHKGLKIPSLICVIWFWVIFTTFNHSGLKWLWMAYGSHVENELHQLFVLFCA